MDAADDVSSTPSLTSSEGTSTSLSDLSFRPLPPIPPPFHTKSKGKKLPSPNDMALQRQRSSPLRPLAQGRGHRFFRIWTDPRILRVLLSFVAWPDFSAVSRTCKVLRDLFRSPHLKDVVISRFVPAYRSTSPEERLDDVRVTLTDLEALMMSQFLPLHRYPMHAVHVVTSNRAISPSAQAFSDRLVRSAQAHSRFILLLRSRTLPWQVNSVFDDFQPDLSLQSLPELTFPAPLSYFDSSAQNTPPPPPLPLSLGSKRSKRKTVDTNSPPPSRASSLPAKPVKRSLSIFDRSRERVPPPEPKPSPPSIEYYSTYRRANRRLMSMTDDESSPPSRRHFRFMTDTLPQPRSPFLNPKANSSRSSLGSSGTPSLPSRLPPSLTLHDLSSALIRTRAPILRVFVPCSILAESIPEAEEQLFTSGLWRHLRPGDVICNLGYVPEDSGSVRGWLIYTGKGLYPFLPPEPTPVLDARTLPSPLYHAHLYPPFENPRIMLAVPHGVRTALHLALLWCSVPSPRSHSGFVRVKRYSWLCQLHLREEATEALGLGEGWAGEWVLEAEGTKEGWQTLVNAIEESAKNPVEREWLVVREKSGAGKIWLRRVPQGISPIDSG